MINLNPITLPFSNLVTSQAEIGSITTMLAYHRARNGTQVSSRVSSLVDGTLFQNVEFGSGVVNSVTLDLANERDWTRTSTILDVNDVAVGQETLFVDTFRVIELSINDIMAKQTGTATNQIEALLSASMQTLENTHAHNQFNRVVELYKNWVPRPEQIVKVELKDVTALTGADLNQQNESNMRVIYKAMNETVEDMLILSNNYTDEVSYTDQNDIVKPIRRSMSEDSMRLVLNSKYNTLMQADGAAPIYNQTTLTSLRAGKRLDIVAQSALSGAPVSIKPIDGDTIGWLHEEGKFALVTFYLLTRSFADGSNLFTNYWLHYAFGLGVFGLAMGVKMVVKLV
jgi:hypothetical protein